MITSDPKPKMACEVTVDDLTLAEQPHIETYVMRRATQIGQEHVMRQGLTAYKPVNPRITYQERLFTRTRFYVEFDLEPHFDVASAERPSDRYIFTETDTPPDDEYIYYDVTTWDDLPRYRWLRGKKRDVEE